jgi:FMN phosphatase YigB (HAD superfamily)
MTTWFLDFDDTLAVGPITWALNDVVPEMVAQHHLPFEPGKFDAAILHAQERSNTDAGDADVIDDLFERLGWPDSLKTYLLTRTYDEYQPALFEDSIAFLDHLRGQSEAIYILSNNNHAAAIASKLGIAEYFKDVFTPKICGGVNGKPRREMWDYILTRGLLLDQESVAMVGDDPWADGAFADNSNLPCWILDRRDRYTHLYPTKRYRWVRSFRDIMEQLAVGS